MLNSLRGSHPSTSQQQPASRSAFVTESDVDLCQKSFTCRGARGRGKKRTGLTFGTLEVMLSLSTKYILPHHSFVRRNIEYGHLNTVRKLLGLRNLKHMPTTWYTSALWCLAGTESAPCLLVVASTSPPRPRPDSS